MRVTCSLYSLALSGAGEESNQIFERPWALVIVFGKAETKDLYADLSGPVIGIVLEEMHMTRATAPFWPREDRLNGYMSTCTICRSVPLARTHAWATGDQQDRRVETGSEIRCCLRALGADTTGWGQRRRFGQQSKGSGRCAPASTGR